MLEDEYIEQIAEYRARVVEYIVIEMWLAADPQAFLDNLSPCLRHTFECAYFIAEGDKYHLRYDGRGGIELITTSLPNIFQKFRDSP